MNPTSARILAELSARGWNYQLTCEHDKTDEDHVFPTCSSIAIHSPRRSTMIQAQGLTIDDAIRSAIEQAGATSTVMYRIQELLPKEG